MRDADFERLYEREAQSLFGFLVYRTGDRHLAEDLLADAFERALRSKARFDRRRGSERTWLYTIALNLLRDHARRAAAEGRALDRAGAGGTEGVAEAGGGAYAAVEQRDVVRRAMERLSEEEREAIALRFGADLSVPEMARVLGEPLTTVEGRVYRALRKLRDRM